MRIRLIMFILLSFFLTSLWGQGKQQSEWLRYEQSQKVKSKDVIESYVDKRVIRSKEDLKLVNFKRGKNQIEHHYYQQHHNGVPIDGAYLSYHSVGENVISSSSSLKNTAGFPSEKAALSEKEALEKALKHLDAELYAWQDDKQVEFLKKVKKDPEFSIYPKGKLMFSDQLPSEERSLELVFQFDILSITPTGRNIIYVNAMDGTIESDIDMIHHVELATGTGTTYFHGDQTFESDQTSTSPDIFDLHDVNRDITTYIMPDDGVGSTNQVGDGVVGMDSDADFSNFSTAAERSALTAQWGTALVYDFFLDYDPDFESFNGMGASINNFVNYGTISNSNTRINAFWNGVYLTYGSGPLAGENSSFLGPVISLDIIAHEYGHAVTQNTTPQNLNYWGEPGALHESFSDIIAVAVENYAINNGYNGPTMDPWIIGELSGFSDGVAGIRSMSDPNLHDQPSAYADPAYWKDTNSTYDRGGVHFNSGVMNYWFYLLTNGSNGLQSNFTGFQYDITGIGIDAAFNIVMHSYPYLDDYYSTFADMRAASIMGCEEAYAGDSNLCMYVQAVIDAWDAVNVGIGEIDPSSCVLQAAIINPTTQESPTTQVCTGNSIDYSSYSNNPSFTYDWSLYEASAPSNILATGTGDAFSYNFSTASHYILELLVTDNALTSPTYGQTAIDQIDIYTTDCQPIIDPKGVMYFGLNMGFDFRQGYPQYITYPNTNTESNICQTDDLGNLLFYTAGNSQYDPHEPMQLYDQAHQSLATLNPINNSSSQIGASVPRPDGLGYKLIMNAGYEVGLSLSESPLYSLDISYENNMLTPESTVQPILPPPNTNYNTYIDGAIEVRENTVVIPGCTNSEFWILSGINNGGIHHVLSYKLIFDGINPKGIILYDQTVINTLSSQTYPITKIQVNNSGSMLISAQNQYAFDRSSGELTFVQQFNELPFDKIVASGAFSPNGDYYYTSDINGNIYQFNTNDLSVSSMIEENDYPYVQMDFLVGPDDKVYLMTKKLPQGSGGTQTIFSVINYPNKSNISDNIGYNKEFIEPVSGASRMMFPKYIEATIPDPQVIEVFVQQLACTSVEVSTNSCYSNHSWDFGDGNIVAVDNTLEAYTHTYTTPGTYTIELLNSNNAPLANETVSLGWDTNTTGLAISGPDVFCFQDDPFELFYAPNGYTYQWSVSSPSNDGTLSDVSSPFVYLSYGNDQSYDLSLILTDENGCTHTLTKTIIDNCTTNTDPCTSNTNIAPLNAGTTVWNSSPGFINQEILVPSGTTLSIENTTLEFGPLGSIRVEDDGALNVSNSTLTNNNTLCPGEQWKGIIMQDRGKVNIEAQSTIENAMIGVHADDSEGFGLTATESNFLDNGTAIYFESGTDVVFKISDNEFSASTTTNHLIRLKDVHLDAGTLMTNEYGIDDNNFWNTKFGVHASDITNDVLAIGRNLGNTFTNVTFGISYSNPIANPNSEQRSSSVILNNTFEATSTGTLRQGIKLSNVPSSEVSYNTVTAYDIAGIHMTDVYQNMSIVGNTLSGPGTLGQWSSGILVRTSNIPTPTNSYTMDILENTITQSNNGLFFEDKDFISENQVLNIDCNQFNTINHGINIKNSQVNAQGTFATPITNSFENIQIEDIWINGTSSLGTYHYKECGSPCFKYWPDQGVGTGYTTAAGDPAFVSGCSSFCPSTNIGVSGSLTIWYDQNIYINNIVTVDNADLLITGTTLRFGPEGGIQLTGDSYLSVINSVLTRETTCNVDKWKGISAEGAVKINVNNQSTIEHAEQAIHCLNNSPNSNNDLTLAINTSTFNNNTNGILIENSVAPIDFKIENSNFISDDPNTLVDTHLEFDNLELIVTDHSIENNEIENAQNGILSTNVTGGTVTIGYGFNNRFTNLNTGMDIRNPNLTNFPSFIATDNTFSNCFNGMILKQITTAKIYSNSFQVIGNLGVKLEEVSTFSLTDNTFTGTYPSNTNWSAGLQVIGGITAPPYFLQGNNFSNLTLGIIFKDCTTPANDQLELNCNSFDNHITAIAVNTSMINLFTNGATQPNSFGSMITNDIKLTGTSAAPSYFGTYEYPFCSTPCEEYTPTVLVNNPSYATYDLLEVGTLNSTCSTSPRLANNTTVQTDEITISPNPNSGEFTIDLSLVNERIESLSISVFNIQGQRIMDLNSANLTGDLIPVDLSKQPAGLYFIQIATNSKTSIKKVMISK